MTQNIYQKWRQCQNYAIIAIVSIICLLFLPFVSSTTDIDMIFPNTAAGWILYVVTKVIVCVVNFLILYCFVSQGKYNVRNHPNVLEANEILRIHYNLKELQPQSPAEHLRSVYGEKGVVLFITTLLSTMTLTHAILVFDVATFLTYLITIISGIIFGIIQMGKEEVYWTEDYWRYAKLIQEKSITQGE